MKKLKLNLSNMKGTEVLTREQLKNIMGGGGSNTCTSDSECGLGKYCCATTDGSNIKVCATSTNGTGCPGSVSGCATSCNPAGMGNIGCVYKSGGCECLWSGYSCT